MRRGTCVKCGAATVRAAVNAIAAGKGRKVGLRPHLEPGFRGIVHQLPADLWTFACTSCGYFEQYLLDAQAIAFIHQSWMPIPPAPTGGSPGSESA